MKESTRKADTAVIGGGAAALALVAMLDSADVTVLERNTRAGKKLLATGNGKCNLTGEDISADGYNRPDVAGRFLNDFPPSAAVAFFNSLGLATRVVNGRVYPYSECASSVLDVLLAAVRDSGAAILTGREVSAVERTAEGFLLTANALGDDGKVLSQEKIKARRIVLASGSSASSGRDSLSLYRALGHSGRPFSPSLVPLKTDRESVKGLNGVRVKCTATLAGVRTEGEILFRDYGLSGIAALDLSALYARGTARRGDAVSLDFVPDVTEKELTDLIAAQRGRTCELVLRGMFHSKVAERIMARAGQAPDRAPDAERIASVAKDYRLTLQGTADASAAQVMSGGLDPDEFDADLQSLLCRGAYAMGEALDVDGICGGYNLQWAWMSAHAVARGLKNLR